MRRDLLRVAPPLLLLIIVCFGVQTAAAGALTFGAKTDFATGTGPVAVAVGDFNGDGKLDLVVANWQANTASVLFGNGSGSFSGKKDLAVGAPHDVAVGDFNGDGKDDIVATEYSGSSVGVFLGDGSGNFGARADHATGSFPASVTVGDFNGDGKQDLATANELSATVSVLLGDGSGGFAAKDFATAADPFGVAVGDFNGDGKQDLVTANYSASGSVSVLLGSGNGEFGARTDLAANTGAQGVAVGDFNGDGRQDLAVANYTSNTASVLLGNGSGGFGAKTDFATGANPFSVAVGDFNGDGKQDLVTADETSNTVGVFLGDGSGGFGARRGFTTGAVPQGVAVDDFNGDGKQDLAVTNWSPGTVSVLLGAREAPYGSMLLLGGAAVTATRAVTIGGVAEATQMRVRGSDGVWSAWTAYVPGSPWTLPTGDGLKTVVAQFRNVLGTTGTLSAAIALDTTPPVTIDDAPPGWLATPSLAVKLTRGDGAGSGIARTEYKVDEAAAWSTGTSLQVSGDGIHILAYRSVDSVGNVEDTHSRTVWLDATAPLVSVTGVDDLWHRTPVLALISAVDATSAVATVSYKLDAGDWTPGRAVLVSTDGDHTVQYKATDLAGNTSAEQTVHVKVDGTGPVTSGKAVTAKAGKKASFKILVNDAVGAGAGTKATIVIRNAAGRTLKTLPPAPVTIGAQATVTWAKCALKAGTYKYVVLAQDAAGNPQSKAGGGKLIVK
jgi:hypothetical protein